MPIQVSYGGQEDTDLQSRIEQSFHKLDEQFSTYKATSDVSLFAANKLPKNKQDALFREILDLCTAWHKKTLGHFDAFYSGTYDPSGIVKAIAIQQAKNLLIGAGCKRFLLNASGDIVAQSSNAPWEIGIQHPFQKSVSIGTISAKNLCVATSGSYERGAHIINPKTGCAANHFIGVTVIGPDITTADVLATALFASEEAWERLIDSFAGYEALVILKDGSVSTSKGFSGLII